MAVEKHGYVCIRKFQVASQPSPSREKMRLQYSSMRRRILRFNATVTVCTSSGSRTASITVSVPTATPAVDLLPRDCSELLWERSRGSRGPRNLKSL